MLHVSKNKHDIYQVRIRVSNKLVPYFNKTEIIKSLGTKKFQQAKRIAYSFISPYQSIDLITRTTLLTDYQIQELVETYMRDVLKITSTAKDLMAHNPSAKMTNDKAINLFLKNYKPTTNTVQYNEVASFMLNIFAEIVPKRSPVENMTLEGILNLREIITKLPKRNIQRYRDMSVKELMKITPLAEEAISATTLNKYIKWTRKFYAFCTENDFIRKNPTATLGTVSNNDAITERLPLTPQEIRKLLELSKDEMVFHNGIKALAYSGMRLSELAKAKINNVEGLDCFDLSSKTLRLKTKASYRIIPIHSSIDIDLLSQLPDLENFSKRVNTLIREHISSDSKKVLYSLRHTVATELKFKRVDSLVISEILGHAHSGMTMGRYASRYPLKILKKAIEKLNFEK
ncbi:DUF6538 domain-containing protein [Sulfurospirillum sp.]|uniref:DUF6538 domain-containing protein n=1 Tax=Sulfurospirillum sp. TaxID=2053622 RepID=UPI002FDD70C2